MRYHISAKQLRIIGKKMRKIREERDVDQIVIAEDAGIDKSYYARLERGEANPTLEVLYAVIKALHAKSSDILPF
jgi:transcriptional regulator with XRE-family HTH domain